MEYARGISLVEHARKDGNKYGKEYGGSCQVRWMEYHREGIFSGIWQARWDGVW